ncbi:dynein regulatory complex protein 8 isoform X1 [Sorex araneus]|uniref:dynein regulatory complex protein 8 isoform X1 n=1 Tax=Sorex araneus TaxID=42254 RepID=UPI002433D8F3|nr:dynein regulatory complex protein 8 isoform X1 [Sorex araneus]
MQGKCPLCCAITPVSKDTVTRIQRQSTEWKRIFTQYSSDKGLIPRVCKVLVELYKKKTLHPIRKWGEEMNRNFLREEIQMAKRHMKRCSSSLIIREMQIKTTMRYHLTPQRLVHTQKNKSNLFWRGCGKKRTLLHCWWECRLVQPFWKTVEEEEPTGYIRYEKFLPVMIKVLQEKRYRPIPEDVLLQAFEVLDPEKRGYLSKDELIKYMTEEGEPFSQEEMEEMLSAAIDPVANVIYYKDYVTMMVLDES